MATNASDPKRMEEILEEIRWRATRWEFDYHRDAMLPIAERLAVAEQEREHWKQAASYWMGEALAARKVPSTTDLSARVVRRCGSCVFFSEADSACH